MRLYAVSTVFFFSLVAASLAHAQAQAAPASASPVPSQGPAVPLIGSDVVRLSNGGMLRGTITEFVPNEYVIIVTGSGETRRFAASELQYAGPVSSDAASVQPPPPPPAPSAPEAAKPAAAVSTPPAARAKQPTRFHFIGREPGLTLHLVSYAATPATQSTNRTRERTFSRLCTAPCDASVSAGPHTFAVSRAGAAPARSKQVIELRDGQTLQASYLSRKKVRTIGWALFGALVAAGIGVATIPLTTDSDAHTGPLAGGAVLMVAGGASLAVLATRKDEALFTVR